MARPRRGACRFGRRPQPRREQSPHPGHAGELHSTAAVEVVNKILECPICLEIPLPPIYTCGTGHNICGGCKTKVTHCGLCNRPYGNARNFTAEAMVTGSVFKCRHAGCEEILRGDHVREHIKICKHGPAGTKSAQITKALSSKAITNPVVVLPQLSKAAVAAIARMAKAKAPATTGQAKSAKVASTSSAPARSAPPRRSGPCRTHGGQLAQQARLRQQQLQWEQQRRQLQLQRQLQRNQRRLLQRRPGGRSRTRTRTRTRTRRTARSIARSASESRSRSPVPKSRRYPSRNRGRPRTRHQRHYRGRADSSSPSRSRSASPSRRRRTRRSRGRSSR